MHDNFRMIMLANRPGFPFLGNDLFGVLGDLFSVHVVDNPSRTSEIAMLKQYGPGVLVRDNFRITNRFRRPGVCTGAARRSLQ